MAIESVYEKINDYGSVRVALASPNDIRSWSFGEVKKPETINYRTYRAERDGLFCERIFGPERDWECFCGKYKGTKHKGMICDRCGVKVTHSRVRRKRMGHINLAAPVVHIWFFKAMPSRLGTLLDMKVSDLEKVIYFQDYVVVDPGPTPLKEKQLLSEEEYREMREQYGTEFEADMGAEAVKKMLQRLDLAVAMAQHRIELEFAQCDQAHPMASILGGGGVALGEGTAQAVAVGMAEQDQDGTGHGNLGQWKVREVGLCPWGRVNHQRRSRWVPGCSHRYRSAATAAVRR